MGSVVGPPSVVSHRCTKNHSKKRKAVAERVLAMRRVLRLRSLQSWMRLKHSVGRVVF